MEDRHTDIGMKRVVNEIRGEIEKLNLRKIIAEEKNEYKKFEQEEEELRDEWDVIFSKVKKMHRGRMIGLTKKEDERLSEIDYQLRVIDKQKEKIQITAYQKIKKLLA